MVCGPCLACASVAFPAWSGLPTYRLPCLASASAASPAWDGRLPSPLRHGHTMPTLPPERAIVRASTRLPGAHRFHAIAGFACEAIVRASDSVARSASFSRHRRACLRSDRSCERLGCQKRIVSRHRRVCLRSDRSCERLGARRAYRSALQGVCASPCNGSNSCVLRTLKRAIRARPLAPVSQSENRLASR